MANSYDVTRIPFKPQQQIVNWNSCTADEILNYEEEGQEVPEQYLRWAEEMSAAMNVQDDVTYEMAQANEGGTGEDGGLNSAQTFRGELADSGVSLKQQGKIFITESQAKEAETITSIGEMAPLLNQAQEIDNQAKDITDTTKTRLEEIKSQVEAAVNERDNLKTKIFGSREDKGELKGLQAVAGALANAASAQLEGLGANLEDIQGVVNEGAASSKLSVDYGAETVAIGKELVDSGFMGIFNGKRKVGKEAVQQGTQTETVGTQGTQIAQEAADANGIAIQTVGGEAGKVQQNTDTSGSDTGSQGENPQEPESGNKVAVTNEKTKTAKAPEESEIETAQEDPSKIVTDPNEILKRKERLGLT